MAKRNIDKAKAAKKDEFYTQLEDINNELRHYRDHFRGKTVWCNCDAPPDFVTQKYPFCN